MSTRAPIEADHELAFVGAFIKVERQERWKSFLANERRRPTILHRLADSRDFQEDRMVRIDSRDQRVDSVVRILSARGSPARCYVISELGEVDGRILLLWDALNICFGAGVGSVISCLPGRLCYFEEETAGERWLLSIPKVK